MQDAISLLEEIKRLLELQGENPFRVRAFDKAAQELRNQELSREDLENHIRNQTLNELPGIGTKIEEILSEFVLTGRSTFRDQLLETLPPGLLELTEIPGLGPKKARLLIDELGIHSLAELEYACQENRLLKLKGFGPKMQAKIMEGIQFKKSTQGQMKLVDALPLSELLLKQIQAAFPQVQVSETGSLRRKAEVVSKLQFLLMIEGVELTEEQARSTFQAILKQNGISGGSIPIELVFSNRGEFGYALAQTTSAESHWNALGNPPHFPASTEQEFYEKLGLPWIAPELRETGEEVEFAKKGKLAELLPWDGVKGIFHNHSTWSDGINTIEEMVSAAEREGYHYIGISDHSQSAFYAQGLKLEQLKQQEEEIQRVREKHPRVRVFWGVESDILADGSLDYEPEVLERFDFVIASVHSRFKMNADEMTQRLLKAIRNPYTRFLGHPTGRLLLGRKPYEFDHEAVISEAAAHGVAIELNSNPARLDFDWRWGQAMRKHGTLTSINPDAHDIEGIQDTRFGIAMARKALIPCTQVVNSRSVQEVEKWLRKNG